MATTSPTIITISALEGVKFVKNASNMTHSTYVFSFRRMSSLFLFSQEVCLCSLTFHTTSNNRNIITNNNNNNHKNQTKTKAAATHKKVIIIHSLPTIFAVSTTNNHLVPSTITTSTTKTTTMSSMFNTKESFANKPSSSSTYAAGDDGGLSLLSAKLNSLDLQERNNALHDIHGVRDNDTFDEVPDFVNHKIKELQSHLLDCIATFEESESLPYRTALARNPQYVERMYLRFLRADMFDSKAAAHRLILHFKFKGDLFGYDDEKLVTDICYDDLGSEEKEVLKQGFVQLLPCRDRAGRTTIFFDGNVNQQFPNGDAVFRALFWFTMAVTAEDVDTQKKGIAVIYWSIAQKQVVKMTRMREFAIWGDASPIRLVSHHVCMDKCNIVFDKFLNVLTGVAASKKLARARFHTGTSQECIYNLMTFGFPREAIPITDLGFQNVLNNRKMLDLLQRREEEKNRRKDDEGITMQQFCGVNNGKGQIVHDDYNDFATPAGISVSPESSESYEDDNVAATQPEVLLLSTFECNQDYNDHDERFILVPANMDVILGKRGQQPNKRPGLLRMHNLISEYQEQYEATPRSKKLDVAKIVLNEMQVKSGCRFLVDQSSDDGYGGYILATEKQALEKISHAFRNLRIKQNKQQQKSSSSSSNKTKAPTPMEEETNLVSTTSTDNSGGSKKKQRSGEATSTTDFDPIPFDRLRFF